MSTRPVPTNLDSWRGVTDLPVEHRHILASFENRVGNGISEIEVQGRAQPGGANP